MQSRWAAYYFGAAITTAAISIPSTTRTLNASNPSGTLTDPATLYRRYAPSIATIETSGPGCPLSQGTGFFVSADGLIATNKHVVECALRRPGGTLSIRWPRAGAFDRYPQASISELEKIARGDTHTSKDYQVAVCGKTRARDLCILKVTVPPLQTESPLPSHWFKVSARTLSPGTPVFTIGNAGGKGLTFKSGRFLGTRNHDGASEIATSIPTIGGNSGGPIFNETGELIGVHYLYRYSYSPLVPKDLRSVESEKNGLAARELDQMLDQFYRQGARTITPSEFQQRVAPTLDW